MAGDTEIYERVGTSWEGFSPRESLAIEFAERFVLDHHGMDDAFWARLRAEFSDEELVDLTFVVGQCLSMGRILTVLDLDHEA